MKNKKISDIIIAIVLIAIVFYLFFTYKKQVKVDNQILKYGYYNTAIINKEYISKQSTREFTYTYRYKNKEMSDRRFIRVSYFNKHTIGDTIIIKFLPDEPEKSMIIEDKEYKSCYGLPPKEGWKELPKCK
jgi:hypothetical protein